MNEDIKKLTKKISWATVLAVVGFLLSPLSWWNDLVINVPLAFAMTLGEVWVFKIFGSISEHVFVGFFVINYWLTNLVGFLLIHHGAASLQPTHKHNLKKEIISSLLWSLVYMAIIIAIVQISGVKHLLDQYLGK